MAVAIFRNLTQNSDNRRELAERLYKGVDIDEHPEKKMLKRINNFSLSRKGRHKCGVLFHLLYN